MIAPIFLYLAVLIFGMNVIPAFMPPTWIVLAFFHTMFHLEIFPTVVVGAISATIGRIVLALIARHYFRPILPQDSRENYNSLGNFFHAHEHITIPILILYAFFPLPSNQVYIVAGLANVNLTVLATSFFFGRLISYSFWVSTAHTIGKRIADIFGISFQANAILFELIGFGIIILVGRIKWRKLLKGHLRH